MMALGWDQDDYPSLVLQFTHIYQNQIYQFFFSLKMQSLLIEKAKFHRQATGYFPATFYSEFFTLMESLLIHLQAELI